MLASNAGPVIRLENVSLTEDVFRHLVQNSVVTNMEDVPGVFNISERNGRLICDVRALDKNDFVSLYYRICYYAGVFLMAMRFWTDGTGASRDKIIRIRKEN